MELIDHLGVPEHDAATIRGFAQHSDPFSAIWSDDGLAGLAGLVPGSLLSDAAYLWLHTTKVVARHRVALGRLARKRLRDFIAPYSVVFGHCMQGPHSRRWVQSLGAEFDTDGVSFRIVRQ